MGYEDSLLRQFAASVQREKTTATDGTGAVHNVLFRENKNTNNTTDHATIFYLNDDNILIGDSLKIGNNYYLIVILS